MGGGWRQSIGAHTFRDQSVRAHAIIVVVSALLGIVTYGYLAAFLGGPGGVAADGAVAVRRTAAALSGVVVGVYLAVAFVRGIGGPLLNLGYVLAHLVLTPAAAVVADGASMPTHLLLGRAWLTLSSLVEVVLVVVLPVSAFFLSQALWFRHRCSSADRIAWVETHLPEGYRGTLLDPSRFDRQRESPG